MRHRIINIHPDDDFYPSYNILVGCEGEFDEDVPFLSEDGVETGFFWGTFSFGKSISGNSCNGNFENEHILYFRGLAVEKIKNT